jgi:RNA polymerase sigma-70 factor (ECF subfamily)
MTLEVTGRRLPVGDAMCPQPPPQHQLSGRFAVLRSEHDEADAVLVRQCLAGNRASFDLLVQRYQKVVFNLTLRMLNDPDDALDAAQSTFLKAYERLGSFDLTRRFFSWLYRIAVNESSNTRQGRRDSEPLSEDMVAPGRDPAQELAAQELKDAVAKALQQLPAAQRQVVVLRHYAELTYAEIAEVLEIPEKPVKSRLFEARRRLADLLAQRGVVR